MDVGDDPRLDAALAHFNAGDYEEAADLCEELFFEAVRDEVDFVRVLLQVSTGFLHEERGQRRPAVERLEEGLRAMRRVQDSRGVDLGALRAEVMSAVNAIVSGERATVPKIHRRRSENLP